jgi:hypothetical protein
MKTIIFKTIGLILLFLVLLQVAVFTFNNFSPWLGILIGAATILGMVYILIITFVPNKKE